MAKAKKQHRQGRGGKSGRRDVSPDPSPLEQITKGVERLTDRFKQDVRRMVRSQFTGMDEQNAAVKKAAQQLFHSVSDHLSTRVRRLATTSPFRKRRR